MKERDLRVGLGVVALATACIYLFPQAASAQAPAAGAPAAGAEAAGAQAPAAGGRQGRAGGGGGGGAATLLYAFKPKDISFPPGMKPVTHIADIIAEHKGQSDWEHMVVKDPWFLIQYIQLAPGKKTPVSFQTDTIIWFIINSGQVQFNVKGQDPIIAGVDSVVSIPARVPYSIETLGTAPSIRFEVRNSQAGTAFPVADNPTAPTPPPGFEVMQVNCGCVPAPNSKARFFDYGAWARANPDTTQRPPFPDTNDNFFVRDPNGFMTFGRSVTGTPIPAPGVIGHFHLGLAEWWYAIEGDMATRIEGVGDVFAKHGDIIYSPRGAFHQTIMTGKPSTRTPAGKTGANDSGASFTKPGAAAAGQ